MNLPNDLDTLGLAIDIEPCAEPARIALNIVESNFHINYTIAGPLTHAVFARP